MNELAEKLHIKPSSASKMVSNLKQAGYLEFEKYGYIVATKKGIETGNYLLYRHDVLRDFLCAINHSDNELEQVEKIEHFINKSTIEDLEKLTQELIKAAKSSEQKTQS
ncbi:MAG: iron dependent repressor, metal binding and dimerization domain protein [Oscillospiraceae bacterium]|nr:iron dependent repressor, metal binding and dimerization domain protein [Oscillospiraceae bacterium]